MLHKYILQIELYHYRQNPNEKYHNHHNTRHGHQWSYRRTRSPTCILLKKFLGKIRVIQSHSKSGRVIRKTYSVELEMPTVDYYDHPKRIVRLRYSLSKMDFISVTAIDWWLMNNDSTSLRINRWLNKRRPRPDKSPMNIQYTAWKWCCCRCCCWNVK